MALVTVIMSVYNEPIEWIKSAIDSIIHQTYLNLEIIIIDDNPDRHDLRDVLGEYQRIDNRIVIIINNSNIGLTRSLNQGLKIAKGEYIARMDADDISLPHRINTQVEFLETHRNIAVCGSSIRTFGAEVDTITFPEYHEHMHLYLESPFAHPTVMIRTESIMKVGGYNECYKVAQDYDLWFRLHSLGYVFHNLDEVLLLYRVSQNQVSYSKNNKQHENARKIRRMALRAELHKMGYYLTDNQYISFQDIREIKALVNLDKTSYNKLLYYLYLSTDAGLLFTIIHLIVSLDLFSLSVAQIGRVLYYKLTNTKCYKF